MDYDLREYLTQIIPHPFGFALQSSKNLPPHALYPEEKKLLSPKAVKSRKLHFTMGRVAAHKALQNLGAKVCPVLRCSQRAPLWPEGVVGSIAHSGDWALALVSYDRFSKGLGIDIEEKKSQNFF